MSLVKKTEEMNPAPGVGLDELLKNLIATNPKLAMEMLDKLRNPEQETVAPTKYDKANDQFVNPEYRNFGMKGEVPKAVKITVLEIPNESKWVSLKCGDKPRVHIVRGIPWIIPMEYLSGLDDMVVESFEHIPLMTPDPKTGNVFERQEFRRQRAPYQVHGEVPWSEYEEFREKLAQSGGKN